MKRLRPALLLVACGLLVVTPVAAAAPEAGPCATGAAYDPACDVDHDGDVDIFDVQKTAGHWNQTGAWTSDNDHDHLGQTWTGSGNPIVLGGSYGNPTWAPLALNNSAGAGVRINAQGGSGVWVEEASLNGVLVDSAGGDGVYVCHTGSETSCSPDPANNGMEIGSAEDHGVAVFSAGDNGLFVYSANDHGVDAFGYNLAGFFFGPVTITGGCTGCLLASFGVNTGDQPLQPGDLVSLAGLRDSGVDSVPVLLEVQGATGSDGIVGVVQGWAEMVSQNRPRPDEIGLRLVPREGAVEPGQYVTIAYSGLTQVKASGPIAQGSKLAVGANGAARPLRTVTVDGVELAENASAIGLALENLDRDSGLIWVLLDMQ